MNSIEVLKLKEENGQAIDTVRSYLASHWNMSSEQTDAGYIRPSFKNSFPYIFFAQTPEGEFAGMILLVLEQEGYLGILHQPWITGLYVPEAFRGRGVARKLIMMTEEKCMQLGYKALYLDTASAAGYYRHIGGWEELGTAYWKEGGKNVVVMKKVLQTV